jgi:hypothetical protein
MKNLICVLILLALSLAAACSAKDNRSDDLETALHHAFRAIYLSTYGLNYPGTDEGVAYCIAYKDKDCLDTFNYVMDAKQLIVAQIQADPERVLNITLDTIFTYAELIPDPKTRQDSSGIIPNEQTTYTGAIMALYFFNRDEQDQVIFNRMKNAPLKILEGLFGADAWLYNRPHPERWVTFVETLPENPFSIQHKKTIIDMLKTTDFKKDGIMLDRSDDLKTALQNAFRAIDLTTSGVAYPDDEEEVAHCIAYKDMGCIDTFNYVMDAKQLIVDQIQDDPERVLNITLNTIFDYNLTPAPKTLRESPDGLQNERITYVGAIMALYFFNQDEQDQVIFNRMKKAPLKVLEQLFNTYAWLYNRPHPERWVTFVETLPENAFSIERKKAIIDKLKTTHYKKFGIMLDRPPQFPIVLERIIKTPTSKGDPGWTKY